MAKQTQQIRIDSIFGGHSLYNKFPADDEYYTSFGIDAEPDGYINPTFYPRFINSSLLQNAPIWIKREPKNSLYYIYDASGSVFSANENTISAVTDLNDGGTSTGNGLEYFDNYIYAARATTIARYGPLNGTASWTDDYWVGTLGKTALTNTTYPYANDSSTIRYPNHVLKTGKDGKLYIADVVGGQGVLHYIKTTKTTVEGDTDAGSTYNAIDFPYGYYPFAIEILGDEVVVALATVGSDGLFNSPIKIAFWDPTNPNTYSRIIDFEFPDKYIGGLKNANGVLYLITSVISTNSTGIFTRISRYVGGYSFEQVALIQTPSFILPGAIDNDFNRLVFAANSQNGYPAIYGIGLSKGNISNAVYCVQGATATSDAYPTCAIVSDDRVIFGWATSTGSIRGLDGSNTYEVDGAVPTSHIVFGPYRIGKPFKVTKVDFSYKQGDQQDSTLKVYISVDDQYDEPTDGTLIGTWNFASNQDKRRTIMRTSVEGRYNFYIQFEFNSALGQFNHPPIALPINIEYETYDE